MRRKVMAAQAAGRVILFAAGAAWKVRTPCSHPEPDRDETGGDSPLARQASGMLPLAVPPGILALAAESWTRGPKAGLGVISRK